MEKWWQISKRTKVQKIWQKIKDYAQYTVFGLIIWSMLFLWVWYLISLGLDAIIG